LSYNCLGPLPLHSEEVVYLYPQKLKGGLATFNYPDGFMTRCCRITCLL